MGSSIHISEYGGDCQFCGKATTHDEQFHDYFPDVLMVGTLKGTDGVICSVCAEDPEGFDAETNFSGVITWDWVAKVLRNDDFVEVPKTLFSDSDLNDIEDKCETHIRYYAVNELQSGEEEMLLETSLGDTLLILTWDLDWDSLKTMRSEAESFDSEEEVIKTCQRCGGKAKMTWVQAKCSDLYDQVNLNTGKEYDGYVPDWIGTYGDYVSFTICRHCGQVQGAWPELDATMNQFKSGKANTSSIFDAETFEAPHVGSDALMDIGKDTDLSSFTTSELTKSSAIHGDFDTASLDYSGKQNLEVRAAEKVVCNQCQGTGRNLPDGKKIYKTKIGVCSHCDGNGFWQEAEFAVDWGLTPTPFCRKVEKTQRWDDGRYSCNSKKGHAGLCGNWSRSSSGRVSFEGHEPCKHIIAGTLDCGCILGDGVDDSTATRISAGLSRVLGKREKNAEPYPFDETDCAICLKPFYTSMDGYRCLGCDEMFCDDHYDMDKEMCISCSGSESHDAESDGVKRSCNRNITKHCKDYTLGWVNCPACGQPYTEEDVVKDAESFAAPTGYNEQGPRPFYGNARKMALDRWGNRRFIRRRKDGTYMKNVDVGRSLSMDRRRKSKTWAPAGFRDQGDGSPSLLMRLLDMFKGVDEEVLMAESDLLCDEHDDYCDSCGCAAYDSETDAYIYAYNDGHTDARNQSGYNPTTSAVEITSFKKIRKQAEESDGYWFEEYNNVVIPKNPTEMQEDMLEAFSEYDWYDPKPNDTLVQGLAIAEDPNFHKIYLACAQQDGIIDSSHPAEAYIIAIKVWNALYQ